MSSNTTITRPEVSDLRESGANWYAEAMARVVTDQASLDDAAEILKGIKSARKAIAARLREPIQQAHSIHGSLISLRRDLDAPFERAERIVKARIGEYLDAQEKALRKARIEAEAVARKEAEEAQLARAEELERAGRSEEAELEVSVPATVVVEPAKEAPRAEGVSHREKWSVRVDSRLALVRHIAEHPEFLNLLEPNLVALGELVRAQKENFRFPGCTAVREVVVAVRS